MTQDRLDRNSEWYSDPTAGNALKIKEQEERRTEKMAQDKIKALAGTICRHSHDKNGSQMIEGLVLEILEQCVVIKLLNGEEATK